MLCRDRSEGEKLRYRLARREKLMGAGVHDLLDRSRAHCPEPGDSSDTDIEAVREQ